MKHPQRHAIIAWLIIILDILFFLPCVATGAAVDVAGVYGKEQGVEVVKGWGQCKLLSIRFMRDLFLCMIC
jgi:hypothetical protein